MLRRDFRDLSRQTLAEKTGGENWNSPRLSRVSHWVSAAADNLRPLNAPCLTRDRRLDLPHVRGSWVGKLCSRTDNMAPDKPILHRTLSCGNRVESTKNVADTRHAHESQACLITVHSDDLFDVLEPNDARRLQCTASTKLTLSVESKCRALSRPSTPLYKSQLSFIGVEITRSSSV